MTQNGWRKPTPGLAKAEEFAQAGECLSISKSKAIIAVKKVAASIGLKASDILLLDTLLSVTQPQDWEEGNRPIVWASNAFLEEQTGFSLTALRRHIRRLSEAGIIAMKDSPNGKRWGKRDDEGYIIEAYGFDLAPLAARSAEFEALHIYNLEERAFCQSLRKKITVSRRVIRAKIENALETHLRGPWKELQGEFSLILERLPKRSDDSDKLMNLADWFNALREKVDKAFIAAFDSSEEEDSINTKRTSFCKKMAPKGANNDTHILTTNKLNYVNSSNIEKSRPYPSSSGSSRQEVQEKKKQRRKKNEVELSTVIMACPKFTQLARKIIGGYIHNWDDFHHAAGIMSSMIGISKKAWNTARIKLGPLVAAAAIALIYDKTESGEINSAGGYLRGIVCKSLKGELHLDRSFYGRLNRSYSPERYLSSQ